MIKQTDLRQTGVAQVRMKDGNIASIPLFSGNIIEEAQDITGQLINSDKVLCAFHFNTISSEFNEKIKKYLGENGVLPVDYMNDLKLGITEISKADDFIFSTPVDFYK